MIGLLTGPENIIELVLKVRFRLEKRKRDQGELSKKGESVTDYKEYK